MANEKVYPGTVIRKILAAFLLAGLAISLALLIARFSFREMMGTVDKLSVPNEKLSLLNHLFEKITTLDQLQRAEAINNPDKPYTAFLQESASLNTLIDSLTTLSWDENQLTRLEEMRVILENRNRVFFSYLKVKANLLDNKDFSIQLDTLTTILKNDQLAFDTSVFSTERKTTTTYIQDTLELRGSDQRSFLKKLFNSKKKPQVKIDTTGVNIREELSIVVDTVALARQNEAIKRIEKIMREMEADQRSQRKMLQKQELELVNANSLFINQLLSILHDVENEEFLQIQRDNNHAVQVMDNSLSRIQIILLTFFLCAALLVYLIAIDISKSNYYKEQLEKALVKAEELGKIKQRFLANMSHEIRTPLQSIIGFAEQLKRKTNEKDEAVDAICSSSEHLLHIVNEVLDYSRISSGTITLAEDKFRLFSLVREVEASMRIQAERKNLSFILDTEKASEQILLGDPFRLRQILYNVIGNAIKFTHRGFIKLAVKTFDEGKDLLCVFEVTDTGIGISKEDLNKIFYQFEQANPEITKHYGGTGLGLTIVKTLVDAHGGLLEVFSEPDVGSTFRVELRFHKAPAQAVPKSHQALISQRVAFQGKVMVVDDDPLIVRLCSLILKKNDIDHVVYNSAKSVHAEDADPFITHIFLDIRMPDINGVDLCHVLRRKYPASTRFVALTAHVLPEEKETLLQDGFDAILTKPFHEHELLNVLGLPEVNIPVEKENQPDLSLLRKMTMGDEVLFQSVVTQFVDETIDDLRKVKEEVETGDAAALRETIHKMAGRFAQMGIVAIAGDLQSVEQQLVAGKTVKDLNGKLNELTRHVDEILTYIRLTNIEQLN